jgi:hypothetical protein
MRRANGSGYVVVLISIIRLDEILRILDEGTIYARLEGVVWQSWGVETMRACSGWGMLNVGIGYRVGVNVVVLRRDIMAWWWIVTRHVLEALSDLRSDGVVEVRNDRCW